MLKKRNQKGFTLIEIIAVLVILGILAAVAVPKYLDLQEQAELTAAKGIVAELNSRSSLAFAKLMVTTGAANGGVAIADFIGTVDGWSGTPTTSIAAMTLLKRTDGTRTFSAPVVLGNTSTPSYWFPVTRN
jgi:prepilin-type N-terminal cleavage/methylation domain-containing protein